jgi:ferredoxin-NADP reductase
VSSALGRQRPWQAVTVLDVRDEAPGVRTLVLDAPDWEGHLAGQSVDVRLTAEDGYRTQRPYSIASAPEDPRLELTVEHLDAGEVSPYLAGELRAGDRFEIRGPGGRSFAWRVDDGGPLLLVGGGAGLVPLRSMVRHRLARDGDIDVRLVVSVRSPEHLLYRRELESWPAAGVATEVTLTREQPEGWEGSAGRIGPELLAAAGPPPETRPHVFVCGPTAFVEHTATLLVRLGHDPARVRTERFGGLA